MLLEDAVKRAEEILSREEKVALCIKAGVCPKCGETLSYKISDSFNDEWTHMVSFCKNPICNFEDSFLT